MKKSHFVPAFLFLSLVVAVAGCGGGGGSSNGGGGGGSGSTADGLTGVSGGGTTGSGGSTTHNTILNGKYAFSLTGSATATGDPLFMAGSFTADGMGNITGGVEDIAIVATAVVKGEALSGTYSIGSDGRGTLNFTNLPQTFKIAIENGDHGQMTRFDSGASASGTFDLQNAAAFSLAALHVGSYVFEWNGNDHAFDPDSGIGFFNLSNGIATAGAADLNDGGIYATSIASGTFSAPDANGHGTATISYGATVFAYGYDIVSTTRILLIETDIATSANAATVGEADAQSAGLTATSLSGNYAFLLGGVNSAGNEVGMVGQIATSGTMVGGNITSSDVVENAGTLAQGGLTSGLYTPADTVQGVTVAGRFTLSATDPKVNNDNFVVYLISPGQAMIMETDPNQILFGQMLAQSGSPFSLTSLSGNYGIDVTGFDGNGSGDELDFMGQFTSGGNSALTGGTIDINDIDLSTPTVPGNAISGGSYSITTGATGHGTLGFTVDGAALAFHFYFVSNNQIFLVETDGQFLTFGSATVQPVIP